MKAVLAAKYGSPDVLEMREVPKPLPKDNELLICVKATVAANADCAFRQGKPFLARFFSGLIRPRQIPGDVFSGVVEAVGKAVTMFKEGDEVYGSSGTAMGTNAEYVVLAENGAIAIKPGSITHEEAAAISEGALTALPFLRDSGSIRKGHKVLINGASGGVGVYAVQLAKYSEAEVTAVCGPHNLELVKSLGADETVDYTKTDFTSTGGQYDIIFDAVGKVSFARCKKALASEGIYMTTVPSAGVMAGMLFSASAGKKAVFAATGLRKPSDKRQDLNLINAIIEAGQLKAVISRTFTLEQMGDAHRYVETGHKIGSAAVAVSHIG